jgi:P27 family predicted phage terminase small subunit
MPAHLIPTQIHKLEKGTLYGELAERDKYEPKPARKMTPKCPKILNKEERWEWHYFRKILENYGLFNTGNAAHLQMLAVNMAAYRDCLEKLHKTGVIILSQKNVPMYSPYFTALNAIEAKIRANLSELGLSSAGLAKLGALVARSRETQGIEAFLD